MELIPTIGDAPARVAVPLAAPLYGQALRYTVLFDEKPFAEAVLIYMRNGAYKILSPGEEHYGSYISADGVAAGPTEVVFASWPDADWSGNVAWHTLTFNTRTGVFRQVLQLPGDDIPKRQAGLAAPIDVSRFDHHADWDTLRHRFAAEFQVLAERTAAAP